jgi:hypothetical protein
VKIALLKDVFSKKAETKYVVDLGEAYSERNNYLASIIYTKPVKIEEGI